ncbi:hypothetical protein DY000_02061557 [Brassica cretica]|uniref:Chlorophyll a-b binding protein, chloroplastic n=1 Tax=Brassica cretica TaxID=69181 RepID=A0ABQ7AQX4_BRACR|nr:hypothetical protein DY000_02061557 [Brassica cretica]
MKIPRNISSKLPRIGPSEIPSKYPDEVLPRYIPRSLPTNWLSSEFSRKFVSSEFRRKIPRDFRGKLNFRGVISEELFPRSYFRGLVSSKEVFYACDLRNFTDEELRSKPCAENLAVHSGMTSGLVELAVGIILELVPGPGIFGSLSLFGVDRKEVFYACDLRNFTDEELRSKPCAENLAVHSGMTSGLVELAVGIILELVPGPGIFGSLSLFGVDRPCEPVGVGCGESEPDSRPVLPALPNRGFLLPLSWAFRTTRPAEWTGFAFFSDGRRHLRPSDRTSRLCPDRSARNRLLRCSRQEVEGSPWSVVRLAGLFRQGSDLKNPCLPVWPDRSESRNRVFCRCGLLWPRAGSYSWPSLLSITAFVVTVDTFPAGVLSALALTEVPSCVCLSLPASIVIPD